MREGACGEDRQRQLFLLQDGRDTPGLTETRWCQYSTYCELSDTQLSLSNLSSVTKIVDSLPRTPGFSQPET